jgi:predicted GIY-YIG superfamily endonuclease
MEFFVYMLRCSDGAIYTGHTDNLQARLWAHQTGFFKGFTSKRLPVRLIFAEALPTREEALFSERRIKGWSRAKKLALARGDWPEVIRLSRE